MYKHILIPTDGSPLSEMAAKHGVAFAKSINAKVTAMTVSPTFRTFAVDPLIVTDTPEQYQKRCDARAGQCLGLIEATAKSAGVRYSSLHVTDDHPYSAIINAANGEGCDLIFMASHGRRGMSALVLGSETTKVLTHSKIPVLVYR